MVFRRMKTDQQVQAHNKGWIDEPSTTRITVTIAMHKLTGMDVILNRYIPTYLLLPTLPYPYTLGEGPVALNPLGHRHKCTFYCPPPFGTERARDESWFHGIEVVMQ